MSAPKLADGDVIWTCNVEAVSTFLAVQTQWRTVATMLGVTPTGLDYAAVEAGLRLAGREVSSETWADVQRIESGAIRGSLEDKG